MTNPIDPSTYPRRVLVCLAGLSPQVVTETLYALAAGPESAGFVPTELRVITTATGAKLAREQLASAPDGALEALRADWPALRTLSFDPERHLHVIRRNDVELADIESAEDNTAVADTILKTLRPLVRDAGCAIHASIAGGRKSMGFYLGYVMSLLGRPQDRMSHVIVNAPFENHPAFFFPPHEPRLLTLADGRSANTADARLSLAHVAFVRIASGLREEVESDEPGFDALVARAQAALTPSTLHVMASSRQVRVSGASVTLEPTLMAWYLHLALRRQQGVAESPLLKETGMVLVHKNPSLSVGLQEERLRQAFARVGLAPKTGDVLPEDFRYVASTINRALRRGLGHDLSERIRIFGPRDRNCRDGQYGLMALPEHIRIL